MYKILITTRYFHHQGGAAVTTVIVEFNGPADATKAINAVNNASNRVVEFPQTALALF